MTGRRFSWPELLADVIVLACVIWFLPRVWRTGRVNASGRPPRWWPYGEAGWLGYARVLPVCGVVAVLAVGEQFTTGELDRLVLWSLSAFAGLAVLILLVNRPRLLVPPLRRGDAGLIPVRRRSRRGGGPG